MCGQIDSFIALVRGNIIGFIFLIAIIYLRFIHSLFLNDNKQHHKKLFCIWNRSLFWCQFCEELTHRRIIVFLSLDYQSCKNYKPVCTKDIVMNYFKSFKCNQNIVGVVTNDLLTAVGVTLKFTFSIVSAHTVKPVL